MRLIATDLDGTLLNSDHKISLENIEAIKKAQKNGVEVTIATGRSYADVKRLCDEASIHTHIICSNGAVAYHKNGSVLSSLSIPKETLTEALKWLEYNKLYFDVSTDKGLFIQKKTRDHLWTDLLKASQNMNDLLSLIKRLPNSEKLLSGMNLETEEGKLKFLKSIHEHTVNLIYSQAGIVEVDGLDAILKTDLKYLNVAALSFNKTLLERGMNHFRHNPKLSTVVSLAFNFELQFKEVSKGNSLEILSKNLEINMKDVVAIGDNYNDLSMFKKVGLSVAMGNAEDIIKASCSIVTKTNDDFGVAHIIDKLLNEKEVSA